MDGVKPWLWPLFRFKTDTQNQSFQWLASEPWQKWVIAFSSARLCDGGAGAAYVILRQRPVTIRLRKQKNARLLNFINV